MNIILFGPPGAGKGTQADKIVDTFNLYKVSSGDLLREEVKKKSLLGIQIKKIIDNGSLVSDETINNLIIKILKNKDYFNRIVFDGYPRNLNQAHNLDALINKYKQKISCVLSFKVDEETLVKRILNRQTCTKCGKIFNMSFKPSSEKNHDCGSSFLVKRSDDNEKTVLHRFQTYVEKTLPILEYYKKLNLLHEINGKAEIDQIFKEIRDIIVSLEG